MNLYKHKFEVIKENVPECYKNVAMDQIDLTLAKRMEDIVRTHNFRAFYLYGDTGVGKSHASYAIAKYLSDNKLRTVVVKSTAIIKAIKNTFMFCRDSEDPRYEDIQIDMDFLEDLASFKGLLIIDDIGSMEKDSEAVLDRYFEIIDERCENRRFMSFTSNLNPNELVPKLGKRIVDRMMMKCDAIELVGINRRML